MEEKYSTIKEILNKYKKGDYYNYEYNNYPEYKSNGWYEHKDIPIRILPTPSISDLLDMMDKIIEQHPRNIKKILDNLPEEEIQKYLRAKKMAKIKSEMK